MAPPEDDMLMAFATSHSTYDDHSNSGAGPVQVALYRYVAGKAELIALMVDTAAGQPPLLDRGAGGWRAQLGIGPDDCSQCSSATRGCWTPPSAPGSWDPTSSAGWRRPSPPSTARA
jgi:hypothetical protein